MKSFLYSTFILTIANIIVRIMGFSFRIILSRKIGAEGIGLFQLVIPIYFFIATLTTSGIPIAISRIISEQLAKGNEKYIRYIMKVCIITLSAFSAVLLFFCILNSRFISDVLLNEPRANIVLITILPCIFISTLSSIHRSCFYGIQDVKPPAIAEIIEQLIKIVLVLGVLYSCPPLKTEYAAALVAFGTIVGELMSVLFLRIKYNGIIKKLNPINIPLSLRSTKAIMSKLISVSTPITLTRLVGVTLQTINTILIPLRLQIGGYTTPESLSLFGKLTGMAMPIVFLPFTFTSALSVVMIPNLSEDMALNRWSSIRNKSTNVILLTSIAAFPIMSILLCLSEDLGTTLYNHEGVGKMMFYLGFSIPFLCLHHCLASILNGLGKQLLATRNYLIGACVQISCTYFLVSNPFFGIFGFIIGFFLSTLITCSLDFISVYTIVNLKKIVIFNIIKPLLLSIPTMFLINNVYKLMLLSDISIAISLLMTSFLSCVFYLSISFMLKILPQPTKLFKYR